jgi:penicillin amidase
MARKTGSRVSARRAAFAVARLALALSFAFAGTAGAQTITGPGLRAPGSITYDAEGVPVIQAANDYDAAYLLGYAHARDRFFQMDFNRRGASGTVAELVGPAALANDVQLRTLGLQRAANATWQAMSDDTRGWLKSYADGVNFWLSTNPLPPEYGALEITRAAPWSPVDSIVIGKALAFQLSFDLDIDFTLRLGAYQAAGTAGNFNGTALFFEDTHRSAPPDGRVSIPNFRPGGLAETDTKSLHDVPRVAATTMELAQAYRDRVADNPLIGPTLRRREERGASNWWLIGGSRTTSGKPLLANDPHLALDTPSIFMEAHIVSTEQKDGAAMNVVGSSVPGTPAIILGCNERQCWGLTTNPLDVTDTYTERFVLNTFGLPTHTIYQGRMEPVQFILQQFYVNQLDGQPDNLRRDNSIGYLNGAATILVPRRNNGPVLQISGETGLSAQYTGWGPTFELEALRRVNRAQNLDQFRSALTFFDVGSQNFAYADIDGNIAYFTTAEMPLREDLQANAVDGAPPYIIRDGSGARRNEWVARSGAGQPNQATPYAILPPNEMPFVVNPAQGYVANANNDPIGTTLDNNPLNQVRPGGGLYYLNVGYSAYRMGRIDRLIRDKLDRNEKVSEADMRAWQANNQLLDAELVYPYLIAARNRARNAGSWPALSQLGVSTQAAFERLIRWELATNCAGTSIGPFATPTGIREGFDPGDDPAALAEPSQCEIDASIGATIFSAWRGQVVRNVIDATLTRIGVGTSQPGSQEAYNALKNLLDTYATRRGVGASGVNFFVVDGAPNPEDARDFLLLKSLDDALKLLASEPFAPAFNRSTDLSTYRWGRLHRIVFDHPLGGPFNIPGANPYPFTNLSAQLPGLARAGGYEAVDASSHNTRANTLNGFMFGSGPARRFVGEMGAPIVAQQILPGGQSGVIGGPGYVSQLPRWLTNRYKPLNIPVSTATASPIATLSFVPRS